MTFQPSNMSYCVANGASPNAVVYPHIDVRPPTASDVRYQVGQRWIDTVGGVAYTLVSQSSLGGTLASLWQTTTITGPLNTLTGGSGGALSPSLGNINILGTAGQITSSGAGSTLTLSLPAAITAPGSLTTTTTLAAGTTVTGGTGVIATTGNITATNGNLVFGTAGNKIVSTSVGTTTAAGANSFGTVTLVGGTATVATTAITTNSIVMLTRQTIGATGAAVLGLVSRGTIVNGVSIVINSLSQTDATALQASDVSSIGWMIIN